MPTKPDDKSRLVFLIEKDLHDQFRASCAGDGLSQAKFINGIVKAYVEKNKNIKPKSKFSYFCIFILIFLFF